MLLFFVFVIVEKASVSVLTLDDIFFSAKEYSMYFGYFPDSQLEIGEKATLFSNLKTCLFRFYFYLSLDYFWEW